MGDQSSSNAGTPPERGNRKMSKSSRDAVTEEQMDDLKEAAKDGRVDRLYSLIRDDIDILDNIEKMPFVETPLHTAAIEGQIEFAMEVLKLKRPFSKKLNEDGYSPMHLALGKGKIRMVRCLLDFDEELVRVHGKDGLTPLHHVARTGNLDLLIVFLRACPRSIEDVTNKKETVLHVALKSKNFEAFQLLLGWLRRTWFKHAYSWEKKLLNAKDKDGHTVLDIAVLWKKKLNSKDEEDNAGLDITVAEKLPEIVKSLMTFNSLFHNAIDLKSKDSNYLDELKILRRSSTKEGEEKVKHKGDPKNEEQEKNGDKQVQSLVDYFINPVNWEEKLYIFFLRQTANISDTTRNALLVVAVLLLTINYQATVSPPGGVWSENKHLGNHKFQHRIRAGFNSGFYAPPTPYAVGTATMEENIFILISVLNCVSFFVSIFSLILLLPTDFRSGMFGLPLYVLSLCFLASLFITAPVKVFPFHRPRNYYILFCVFSPLLFLSLQGLVLYRRKTLVQAFLPQPKELDPSLHISSTLF